MSSAQQPSKGIHADLESRGAARGQEQVNTGEVLGALLIAAGCLQESQLIHARRVRSKLATPKTLLNVLKDLGYVTEAQLRATLCANPRAVRLGELLVELGELLPAQLEAALELQATRPDKKKLGDILLEYRFIEDYKLAQVLSLQCGMPHVELRFTEVEKGLVNKETLKRCREHLFFPVRKHEGKVVVGFFDPLDSQNLAAAERLFGKNIVPAVATRGIILGAISFFERGLREAETPAVSSDSAVVRLINVMLGDALRDGASDIHIEPTAEKILVRFRCDGSLLVYKEFNKDLGQVLSSRLKIMAKADIAERRRHQDGRLLFEDHQNGYAVDMRASFYVTIHGENIVLRLLNKKSSLLELKDIGMSSRMLERFRDEALDTPSGVMLITGPTGSGKTTTLYSCVNYLNDPQTSIITAEDPVEYVMEGIAQCSINPKLNVTFEETLRHIVRQDPDVIVLGEIRDRFSAETAIQAALTGHKILTTFHTEDSIGGLLRLLNMDIEAFLISSTVVCVVAQRLLRRVCPNCAEPYRPTPSDLRRLGYGPEGLKGATFKSGRGCAGCRFTGYSGRVSVFELLILNELLKDALLNRKPSYEIRRLSLETSGLVTLIEDGLMKAAGGLTSLTEVVRHLPRLHKPRSVEELRRIVGENQ
jgi:type IV pilus assembly protein PilB